MRQNELALRKLLTERLGEGGDPRLRRAIALVHGGQVLVVDVNAVELVVEDELCHGVRGADGVRAGGRGLVGLAECGGDDVDACCGVLSLLGRLGGGVKVGIVLHLVPGTGEGKEREVDDVPALQNTMCQRSTDGTSNSTYSELRGRGKDSSASIEVGVYDEGRARDRDGTRGEVRGLRNRNSENAAHRGQRQRGRDGGDHAGEGEHRWDVKNNKKVNEEEKAD